MRKILIIIYLIFAILSLLAEIILAFRETKKSIYSLDFEKNYKAGIFCESKIISGSEYGTVTIYGHLEHDIEERVITLSEKSMNEYMKYNEKRKFHYFHVWYNRETKALFLKTKSEGRIYHNGFLLIFFWVFILPAIYWLIKHKQI